VVRVLVVLQHADGGTAAPTAALRCLWWLWRLQAAASLAAAAMAAGCACLALRRRLGVLPSMPLLALALQVRAPLVLAG
jgi:hypothetical protein